VSVVVSRGDVEALLGRPEALQVRLEAIWGSATGRVLGFEGLVGDGVHASTELFGTAAVLGLDIHLELLALGRVLERLDDPVLSEGARLGINLSPRMLLLAPVRQLLEPLASRLIVEISEFATGTSMEAVARALVPLREAGLLVALDNAGVGFAGLERLALLTPDLVKLDRSLLASLPSARALFVLDVTIHAAHNVGAAVVAVGVETSAQLAWVQHACVEAWQGYLEPARPSQWRLDKGVLGRVHRGEPPEAPSLVIDADSSLELARERFARVGMLGPTTVALVTAGRLVVGWLRREDLEVGDGMLDGEVLAGLHLGQRRPVVPAFGADLGADCHRVGFHNEC